MAIVHSLAVGKSKKSAGNLTYATVKGRTIAKQKVVDVHNPNTPAQQAQRSAMATIVLFWQIWASAFKPYFTKLKPLFSAFNQFVHMNKTIMHTPGLITADQKIGAIEGMYISSGYYSERSIVPASENIQVLNEALVHAIQADDKILRISPTLDKLAFVTDEYVVKDTDIPTLIANKTILTNFSPSEALLYAFVYVSKDGTITNTAKFAPLQ